MRPSPDGRDRVHFPAGSASGLISTLPTLEDHLKALLLLAHPSADSLNHAIAEAIRAELARAGAEVRYHDLYAERFDPILPAGEIPREAPLPAAVRTHCAELADCDVIVVVHPNWWGQPPAVLKGWVDRVVRPGVAYAFEEADSGEGIPKGLLKAQVALVLNTSNTPEQRETRVFGDPLESLWWNCVFRLCGVRRFRRRMYRIVVTSSAEERAAWIQDAVCLLREELAAIDGGTPNEASADR